MADQVPNPPGDDALTAYLDGELEGEERKAVETAIASDAATKARLEALKASSRPHKEAFQLVLDAAPLERLAASFTDIAPPRAEPAPPRRVWMAAAALLLFAAGVGVGAIGRAPGPQQVTLPAPPPAPATTVALTTPAPTWRQSVADYLGLTTPATLSAIPENPRLAAEVAAYAMKLQLDLTGDKLTLPMASLKDVRLYDYRGRPLVEAAYLSDDAMAVVAFCIILNGQPDAPLAFEQRNGQNIVFWTTGGHGFMVAGKLPREALEMAARDLAARFS